MKKPASKKKCLNNFKDSQNKINFLVKNKLDFKMILSNYTTEIICPEIPYFNIKYLQKAQSNYVFFAYQRIKKDLLTWSANEMPIINKKHITYFDYNAKIKNTKDSSAKNLDLTAAYATILKNDFFISEETFNIIMKLRKIERLAAVGMLAGRKDIFTYQGGKVIMHEEIISPLENYFYYCVDKTAEIMKYLSAILGKDYIFTWVDSVYYNDKTGVNDFYLSNYLKEQNLNFKIQDLRYLNINKQEEKIKISFFDEKAVKLHLQGLPNKPKTFTLPTQQKSLKKEILQFYNLI